MKIGTDDIVRALKAVGIGRSDSLMVHASLLAFGYIEEEGGECRLALDPDVLYGAIRSVIGEGGTLVVPTFSYSWTKGEIFSYEESPSCAGQFTEYVRRLKGTIRSMHPMLSVAAIGPSARDLVADVDDTSFGEGSPYRRMLDRDIKQVMLGVPYSSFKHYVEYLHRVPFRYMKTFSGLVERGGKASPVTCRHYVRYLDAGLESVPFYDGIDEGERAAVRSSGLGGSYIRSISSRKMRDLIGDKLDKDPYAFSSRPALAGPIGFLRDFHAGYPSAAGLQVMSVSDEGVERWVWCTDEFEVLREFRIAAEGHEPIVDLGSGDARIFLSGNGHVEDQTLTGAELEKRMLSPDGHGAGELARRYSWAVALPTPMRDKIDIRARYHVHISHNREPQACEPACRRATLLLPAYDDARKASAYAIACAQEFGAKEVSGRPKGHLMMKRLLRDDPLIAVYPEMPERADELRPLFGKRVESRDGGVVHARGRA